MPRFVHKNTPQIFKITIGYRTIIETNNIKASALFKNNIHSQFAKKLKVSYIIF